MRCTHIHNTRTYLHIYILIMVYIYTTIRAEHRASGDPHQLARFTCCSSRDTCSFRIPERVCLTASVAAAKVPGHKSVVVVVVAVATRGWREKPVILGPGLAAAAAAAALASHRCAGVVPSSSSAYNCPTRLFGGGFRVMLLLLFSSLPYDIMYIVTRGATEPTQSAAVHEAATAASNRGRMRAAICRRIARRSTFADLLQISDRPGKFQKQKLVPR